MKNGGSAFVLKTDDGLGKSGYNDCEESAVTSVLAFLRII
jgi:hypothetical protein